MSEVINRDNKESMTVGQASALITGCGVGSGLLALPYLIKDIGFPMAVFVLVLCYAITCFMIIIFADLAIRNGGQQQILSIIVNVVFRPKVQFIGRIILFILFVLQLIFSLGSYISGAGELICSIFNLTSNYQYLGKLIFFVIAAFVSFAGLKLLGILEQGSIIVMYIGLFALVIGSCLNIKNTLPINVCCPHHVVSFFGLALFSLNSIFAIPQVVKGLDQDVKKIKKSIYFGTALNLFIILIIALFSLLSCKEVTKIIVIGWGEGLGTWAFILGSIFTLFAFLTSYWSLSFALRDMFMEFFHFNKTLSQLIANLPGLVIALIPLGDFSTFLDVTAVFVTFIIAFTVIPGYFFLIKRGAISYFGRFYASKFIIFFTLLGYLVGVIGCLMAIFWP